MPAETISRNLTVNGRRTSLRLEPLFWQMLEDIAKREEVLLSELVSAVESRLLATTGEVGNLHSSLRVYSAEYYVRAASETGHQMARHGLGNPFAGTFLSPRADHWSVAA